MVAGLSLACAVQPEAWGDVEVRTADGRVLAGVVDSRTTSDVLWIRQQRESIILSTPVAWSAVTAATIDGQPVEVAQLAEQWEQLASETPLGFLLEYSEESPLPQPARHQLPVGRVTNLEADALLVNLDRDVEPDGYELAIAAVSESGENIPVSGDLYVRLMVESDSHHTGRIRFEDIQQWSLPVSPHDFEDGVAAYVLPFRQLEPEFDDQLCTSGQLNVRLGVPGQGNFAATVPVVLREFNPYRDRLQMFTSSRFFPNELSRHVRTEDAKASGIYRPHWPQ